MTKHLGPAALALAQALGLWILSDIKTDVRELRRGSARQGAAVAGVVAWAQTKGYRPVGGG